MYEKENRKYLTNIPELPTNCVQHLYSVLAVHNMYIFPTDNLILMRVDLYILS